MWRNPLLRRLMFMTPLFSLVLAAVVLGAAGQTRLSDASIRAHLAVVFALGWPAWVGLSLHTQLSSNYFGAMDREGLALVVHSPIDRRQVLVALGVTTTVLHLALSLLPLGRW